MIRRTWSLGLGVAFAACVTTLAPSASSALPAGAPRIGMVCTTGTVSGTTRTFDLVTGTGFMQTPDGNSVFMWSYADTHDPTNPGFQYPGPVLCVNQGDTVVVNLHNILPEPSSIVFPGQDATVTATGGVPGLFTTEAAANTGNVQYTFIAGNPGTYIYESGSDVTKQIEMGLYGALIVRPNAGGCPSVDAAPVPGAIGCAYGSATPFNQGTEFLMLLSDIDPDLHHAVETGAAYDINALHNRYFAINGRSFPDTIQDNGVAFLPDQPYGALVRIQPSSAANPNPSLIRMLNVGALNHPFHPHGNHTRLIAQDGRLLVSPTGGSASTEHFGETIGSGQTEDFLLRWDDTDQWNPNTNPLPVAQPNYRNLTFKDGVTWYSGNPYLGYKGTLPTGTTSLNVCGEWYFPLHSHALNEFTNFDEGFGGMGTLLRVDPPAGCFTFPTATALPGAVLKAGSPTALAVSDNSYYQVNPRTTTTPGINASTTTMAVASATGFPTSGNYYVRIQNEVLQVTGGQGTTTWTVARGQLGTSAASHTGLVGNRTITALANDWYATFSSVATGAQNLAVTYEGKNCGNTTGTACTAIASNLPQQTAKVCNWTVAGAAGCSTATSAGWVTLPAPPAQPQNVGSTDVTSTWTLPGPGSAYIGTGANAGQVRVLVHTQRWTAPSPTAFSTWGDLMTLTYPAP